MVTGAGSGIGRSIALMLAANGAAVVASDLDADAATGVVSEITEAGGVASAHVGDVSDPNDAEGHRRELECRDVRNAGPVAGHGRAQWRQHR